MGDFALNFAGGAGSGAYAGSPRVFVPSNAELQLTGATTWLMWLRPDAPVGGGPRQNPLAKAYAGEGTWTIEPAGDINLYYGTNGTDGATYANYNSLTTLAPGVWTHAAVVRDLNGVAGIQAADRIRWYLNGAQTADLAAVHDPAVAGTQNFFIGTGYTNGYDGMIDDVAIFNEALSVGEIAAVYRQSLPSNELGPNGLNLSLVELDQLFQIHEGGPSTTGNLGAYELSYLAGASIGAHVLGDAFPYGAGWFLFLDATNNSGVFGQLPQLVPEPASLGLFGLAVAGLGFVRWQRSRR